MEAILNASALPIGYLVVCLGTCASSGPSRGRADLPRYHHQLPAHRAARISLFRSSNSSSCAFLLKMKRNHAYDGQILRYDYCHCHQDALGIYNLASLVDSIPAMPGS